MRWNLSGPRRIGWESGTDLAGHASATDLKPGPEYGSMKRPNGIVEITRHGHTGWFDPERLSTLSMGVFEPEHWQRLDAVTGTAPGRGITWFVRDGDRDLVLRHYRRGGILGKIVHDSYLGWRVERSRPMHEFSLLHQMHREGLPVPAPVAAHWVRRGFAYGADIVLERIPGARSLMEVLQERELPESVWYNIGAVTRLFHDARIDHVDLNIHNVLLDANDAPWLVDFDRCTRRSGEHWKHQNLARLLRSLRKAKSRDFGLRCCQDEWQTLTLGYAEGGYNPAGHRRPQSGRAPRSMQAKGTLRFPGTERTTLQ